jgi:hypothetical protein
MPHPLEIIMDRHALAAIPDFPTTTLALLRGYWIDTAEQLVAATATPASRERLAAVLGLSPQQLNDMRHRARAVLPPDLAQQLDQPPVVDHPMGVIRERPDHPAGRHMQDDDSHG